MGGSDSTVSTRASLSVFSESAPTGVALSGRTGGGRRAGLLAGRVAARPSRRLLGDANGPGPPKVDSGAAVSRRARPALLARWSLAAGLTPPAILCVIEGALETGTTKAPLKSRRKILVQ